jgi:hypothetical protein
MKKIYSLVAVLAIGVAANAQRPSYVSTVANPITNINTSTVLAVAPTDTLAPDADWSQQPSLYGSQGGGYVCGTNGYGDVQKVQIFRPGSPVVVYGAIYWFGAKNVGANSNMAMRIYQLNGTGTSTASNADPCPNTPYISDNVAIGSVDTSLSLGSAYIHTYSAPTFCAGDFGVGCLLPTGAGDTIGLVSTTDPNSNTEDSWEQWSDNSWHTFLEPNNWGLNIALAIFPIVELNTGVNETPAINGVKLGFNGANPFTENTQLTYTMANDAQNVVITVVDVKGQIVKTENLNNQAAGTYTYDINGADLASGTYFVQFQADNARLAVKMVKN